MTDEEKKQLEALRAKEAVEDIQVNKLTNTNQADEVALISADGQIYREKRTRKVLDNSDGSRAAIAEIIKGIAKMAVIEEQHPDFLDGEVENMGDAVEMMVIIDDPVSDVISALFDVNPEEVASLLNVNLVVQVSEELSTNQEIQTAIKKINAQAQAYVVDGDNAFVKADGENRVAVDALAHNVSNS